MKLRQKEFYCPRCDERCFFTELEKIRIGGSRKWLWAMALDSDQETGVISPNFICKCGYAEKLEYLEYPERKPPPSFLKKKLTTLFSKVKSVLMRGQQLK